MDELDVFARLGLALLIGLGIGIERGYHQRALRSGSRILGVRSFTFIALAGCAAALTSQSLGPWLVLVCGAGVFTLVTASYFANVQFGRDAGLTTEIAAIATYCAGVMSGEGLLLAGALTGLATIVLLHNKRELHGFAAGLEHSEIDAALKVLVVACVLLPLVPDQGFGPGGVLNPYHLLWAVVVIAAIGLCGHGALRVWGASRGALALGLLGGLVSSTGVAISAAKMAKSQSGGERQLAAAIGIAQAVMFVRTGLLAAFLNPGFGLTLIWPIAMGCITALAGAVWYAGRGQRDGEGTASAGSPDTLNDAIRFVAVAAAAMIVAFWATQFLGAAGLYFSSTLAGLVDVDAATTAIASFAGNGSAPQGSLSFAALLALTANSISKSVIVWRIGGAAVGRLASGILLMSALAAVLAAIAVELAGT
jgi:uncharacterized membrane protein (DUF4010 family)